MWRPIGADYAQCHCGGSIATYVHHETGMTVTRCVRCLPWTKEMLNFSSRPDLPAPAGEVPRPMTVDITVAAAAAQARRTRKRKSSATAYRKRTAARPCPRGDRCLGDGNMERARGQPSPYGCKPCRAARDAA